MLNYNMPSCNPTQWKTTQPPCRHAALCLHVLKHIPSLASLVCPGGRWPASAQAPVLLSSPKWLALTLVAPPPPSLGRGNQARPAASCPRVSGPISVVQLSQLSQLSPVVPVTQDSVCCRMKSLLLLATFTLSVTVAAPQNGFFSGITNAFNDFFGGSSKSVDDINSDRDHHVSPV